MTKSVCFDVLGTCFDFDKAIEAIEARLGSRLKTIGVDAKTLFFSWFYSAQRDFTYATIVGDYKPIAEVLKHTLRRACFIVDLPKDQSPTDEDVAEVMKAVTSLRARPGLKACYDGLRDAGYDVYGITNGGKETSLKYYALADIELDKDHLLSCDEIKVAKPDIRVYENANRHLNSKGLSTKDGDRWFVAAHAWDLMAARKQGFKTAYLDFEEHDPVTAVFGEFDLHASSMSDLLDKLKRL
jgi:2-haloacid dehalogenase